MSGIFIIYKVIYIYIQRHVTPDIYINIYTDPGGEEDPENWNAASSNG